jgi:hypothetical protein
MNKSRHKPAQMGACEKNGRRNWQILEDICIVSSVKLNYNKQEEQFFKYWS